MASTSDFRNGFTFEYNNDIYSIVEFQHVKPGKGGAFVRTKLKSMRTGKVIDHTFRSGEKVKQIRVERRKMGYLYQQGGMYYLMDNDTYDQMPVAEQYMEICLPYLKENMELEILQTESGEILEIVLPFFVELKVTETEPGFKGDTATGGTKPATLETGATVNVPLFISIGDILKIDTRTGEYLERV